MQLTWDQKTMAAEFSDLWDFQVTFLSCIFKLPGWEKDYTTGLNKDVILFRSFCLFWNSLGIMSSLHVLLLPILKLQSCFLSTDSEKLLCVSCVGGGDFCCAGLWICTTSRAVLCRESRYGYHGSCRCHQWIQGKRHSSQRQDGTENFPQWFVCAALEMGVFCSDLVYFFLCPAPISMTIVIEPLVTNILDLLMNPPSALNLNPFCNQLGLILQNKLWTSRLNVCIYMGLHFVGKWCGPLSAS